MRADQSDTRKWQWSWWKLIIVGIVIGLTILLAAPIAAHASARVDWGVKNVQDYHYTVTEYRKGLVFGDTLWKGSMAIHWSWNPYAGVWRGPSAHRTCWVSDTWNSCTLTNSWKHKLSSPKRWQFYAKWTMVSNGDFLLVDHDHPYLYMTVFADNPQHVSYTASCGC